MRCGKPVSSYEQEYCHDCSHTHHYYEKGAAVWLHKEPVNLSVYQFKFHNQRNFGKYYAKEMAGHYREVLKIWNPDIVIPIPLHSKKQRSRGFNQAAVLAKELAKLLNLSVNEKILRRTHATNPQKKLDPRRRKENIITAFEVDDRARSLVDGKKILLIDDIYTTGSTIDEAAKILKKAGAEKVYYLTISIGQGY